VRQGVWLHDRRELHGLLSVGPAKRTRAGVLWGNVSHDNEQYSALSMYLRLKGWHAYEREVGVRQE